MKRIILYAAVYGGIGAVVGVLMALYTQDITPQQVTEAKAAIIQPQAEEQSNGS